jgi:hypothetical protein
LYAQLANGILNTAPADVTVSPFTGAEPAFEQLFRLRPVHSAVLMIAPNFLRQNLI